MTTRNRLTDEFTTANSTYKKLAVQWLNEVLCFVSSSVAADSFRLRSRQLLVVTNRCPRLRSRAASEGIVIASVFALAFIASFHKFYSIKFNFIYPS